MLTFLATTALHLHLHLRLPLPTHPPPLLLLEVLVVLQRQPIMISSAFSKNNH